MYIHRHLRLPDLLSKKSHFLLGPRGVGKSSLIHNSIPEAFIIDLLKEEFFDRLIRNPAILREIITRAQAKLVVIDEVQRLPRLLNEVHSLIEEKKIKFLLTGSSARKLRRGGANLLAGRAWDARLFPFTSAELGDIFDLPRYLSYGGLPAVVFSQYPEEELRNYIKFYLREEIQVEGIVRKFEHFVRFLDVAALNSGEELNYDSVASDAGVPPRTAAGYFQVLEDTLVGFQVPAFRYTKKRKAISRSKFFLFDVGVAGALTNRGVLSDRSELFGRALEQFIAVELRSFLNYSNLHHQLCYWRTTSQQEVDFVVGRELAIEVKATHRASEKHFRGLRCLGEEKMVKRLLFVSQDPLRRTTEDGIELFPITAFLNDLWAGKLIRV